MGQKRRPVRSAGNAGRESEDGIEARQRKQCSDSSVRAHERQGAAKAHDGSVESYQRAETRGIDIRYAAEIQNQVHHAFIQEPDDRSADEQQLPVAVGDQSACHPDDCTPLERSTADVHGTLVCVGSVPGSTLTEGGPNGRREGANKEAGPFEPMPGRPSREYVTVPSAVRSSHAELHGWLVKAQAYAGSKAAKKKRK
jgi:hypothetical protein